MPRRREIWTSMGKNGAEQRKNGGEPTEGAHPDERDSLGGDIARKCERARWRGAKPLMGMSGD